MKKLTLLLLICASTLQGMNTENWPKQLKRKMYQLICTKRFLSKTLTLATAIDGTVYFDGCLLGRFGKYSAEDLFIEMDFHIKILNKAYGEFSSKNCGTHREGSCYEEILQFIGKSIRKE